MTHLWLITSKIKLYIIIKPCLDHLFSQHAILPVLLSKINTNKGNNVVYITVYCVYLLHWCTVYITIVQYHENRMVLWCFPFDLQWWKDCHCNIPAVYCTVLYMVQYIILLAKKVCFLWFYRGMYIANILNVMLHSNFM